MNSKCVFCGAEAPDGVQTSIPIITQNKFGRRVRAWVEDYWFCAGGVCVTQFCLKSFSHGNHPHPTPTKEQRWYDIAERYVWETQIPTPYRAGLMDSIPWYPAMVRVTEPPKPTNSKQWLTDAMFDEETEL